MEGTITVLSIVEVGNKHGNRDKFPDFDIKNVRVSGKILGLVIGNTHIFLLSLTAIYDI
jgi:hypothetical protein